MTVAKLSVSFEPELAEAVKQAAEDEDETVSAWLAEAARQRVRHLMLGRYIAEMMEEHGWTEADLEAAAEEARAKSFWVGPAARPSGRARRLTWHSSSMLAHSSPREAGAPSSIGMLAAAHRQNVPVRTSAAVVAQVWRGGLCQALLARALTGTTELAARPGAGSDHRRAPCCNWPP